MIFFLSIRVAALAATTLIAGAAAAMPYQVSRIDADLVRTEPANCLLSASADACDSVAILLDIAEAEQVHPTALYQDLLTPLEGGHDIDGPLHVEAGGQGDTRATPPAVPQPATPVPEQRPYTMLLVGLGLLAFSSRKKSTEKFRA